MYCPYNKVPLLKEQIKTVKDAVSKTRSKGLEDADFCLSYYNCDGLNYLIQSEQILLINDTAFIPDESWTQEEILNLVAFAHQNNANMKEVYTFLQRFVN